jgi:iron complex transport system ATP-binding protein
MIKKGAIIADGRCEDVVNSETLLQLYNIRVNVIRLNGTLRVCVPEMLKDNGAGEGTERPSVFVHRGTLRR